jgi:hypothetical protein
VYWYGRVDDVYCQSTVLELLLKQLYEFRSVHVASSVFTTATDRDSALMRKLCDARISREAVTVAMKFTCKDLRSLRKERVNRPARW